MDFKSRAKGSAKEKRGLDMTENAERIFAEYQVRKTRAQKAAFLEHMQAVYPQAAVEEGGALRNRNLVVGDVETAEFVLAAHYDTCARLPFPNFISPRNIPLYLLYSLAICLPFLAVGVAAERLMRLATDAFLPNHLAFFVGFLLSFLGVMMMGPANPHTANDNTSGVLTLVEAYETMTEAERGRVALVFFDNEENGLLGSARFAKVHREQMKGKLLLNFDCVSDGDELMLVLNKGAKPFEAQLRAAFLPTEGKQVHFFDSARALYPSDQVNFRCGVGVAAFKRKKGVGLYMNRIHTPRDTVLDERNIACLAQGVRRFLDQNNKETEDK